MFHSLIVLICSTDVDSIYANVPTIIPNGHQPWEEEWAKKSPEYSERSNEHSSYDPRVSDLGAVEPRRPAHRPPPPPPPPAIPAPSTRAPSSPADGTKLQRTESRGSRHTSKPYPSPRGSLLSPGGLSVPSLPGYFTGGPVDKTHHGGPYRPDKFHPHHYEQIVHERPSRPRSKRTTATSQDLAAHGASGSKHSLIISTKRRTLSGVTGTNPIKQRSNSMNALWFGDHPVPSPGALSPNAPLRLSNIQLQAQAELERRHRSSSRAHSLDRRSGLSYGYGTESRLSGAPTDVEGYEGVGYGYDTRGRLIHGGAPIHERAISRKRRLLDGHESLSRVWIPQTDAASTVHSEGPSRSAATRLTEMKAHLDDSAVAFALRDFTAPGVRLSRRASDGDQNSKASYASEHIYAHPSSLKRDSEIYSRVGHKHSYGRRPHSHFGALATDRNSLLHSTRSLYRSEGASHRYQHRPRLVPDRWGSVPLPNPTQYDSLMRSSALSMLSHKSLRDSKYVLESNV
ncbi:unnamed protein product [Echinostoma caproni]|uniref:Uncharacterized protein n=1 Tax=Echinostoma caproni TaxID=27848 RepID=A0A3P8FHR6_9TREM|nr:unnamed protein product [Echinostoma caproni]